MEEKNEEIDWVQEVLSFMTNESLWLIPVIFIALKFMIKVFMAERTPGTTIWKHLLNSPIETGFLALSFIASIIITDEGRAPSAFIVSFIFLFLLLISMVASKYSPKNFTPMKIVISSFVLVLNYTLVIGMLIFSLMLIKVS